MTKAESSRQPAMIYRNQIKLSELNIRNRRLTVGKISEKLVLANITENSLETCKKAEKSSIFGQFSQPVQRFTVMKSALT